MQKRTYSFASFLLAVLVAVSAVVTSSRRAVAVFPFPTAPPTPVPNVVHGIIVAGQSLSIGGGGSGNPANLANTPTGKVWGGNLKIVDSKCSGYSTGPWWQPGASYAKGQCVYAADPGDAALMIQDASGPCLTDSGEPAWPRTIGSATTDG